MAASLKTLRAAFLRFLEGERLDPEMAISDLRAALVAREKGEISAYGAMLMANRALKGFGVDSVYLDNGTGAFVGYCVNMGDLDTTTVVYSSRTGRIYVASRGDWLSNIA